MRQLDFSVQDTTHRINSVPTAHAFFGVQLVVVLSVLLSTSISCGNDQASGGVPTNASPPPTSTPQSYSRDVLQKYSLDALRSAFANRRNQTLYEEVPAELREVSDDVFFTDIREREKTIYGHDRRRDYLEIENSKILEVSSSVAALFTPDRIILEEGRARFVTKRLGDKYNLCSGESFADQPVAPFCTSFVIDTDLVATAGHCLRQGWGWQSLRIVFGYRNAKDVEGHTRTPAGVPIADVFAPVELISEAHDSGGVDFAILRVERPLGHAALTLNRTGPPKTGAGVYTLGYPSGLPLKYAGEAVVRAVNTNGIFLANLDTFGGNSGSPVLDANSHVVAGILVRGDVDYKPAGVGGCQRAFVCPKEKPCIGEDVTMASMIRLSQNKTGKPANAAPPRESKALPADLVRAAVITRTFSSGAVPSGAGASFSAEYTVVSDPAPDGYSISDFSYSLSGDRVCHAWSTCTAAIENGRVVFRFRMQGHSEWLPPGQALSSGTLIVSYKPIS